MSFATRFASLGGTRGLATALAVLVSAPVLAQTAPAQQPARPSAPAQQPARPAAPAPAQQPAQGAAQAQQNAGPTVVQVKAEPSQPEWTKVCGKDQNTNTEICYTTRDFVSDQGQPVLALAVYDVKGQQAQKVVRFVMPLGLLLQPGLRFTVDQGQAVAGRYVMCLPNGCFAEAAVKDDFIASLKKGANLNVSVQNQMGREITFAVPAAGFGKSFDGPPIDPKVLEEQQKKLQEELQKKSEEMRQRMLQGQGAAPAAPGAAAPAAQAAPKP
ncbi:invasion protein IalB [Microvirga lupini]|uniref:Invasion protein IalB n=1 Tax=Microvirga lupini TaxID=420324 RepID=A0A7W4YXI5_9HYPH|nr:invasion associated locus B family protein [Microvirga lupini]MBB3019279.1 invasion protein IalB [Microvirga lupini]